MAKPTKYATLICLILSLLLLVDLIIGILRQSPIVIAALLLPAVIYEAYRTEGRSTKWASFMMVLVILAELYFIIFKVSFNLAQYLGRSEEYLAGQTIPLGDVKVIFPVIMGILSLILFFRTRGIYTKWLAVLIFAGAFAIVYTIDKDIFNSLLQLGIDNGLDQSY